MSAIDLELVDATRGGRIESCHRGRIIVLARGAAPVGSRPDGLVEPVFVRSALKPLQASAMVASGFGGPVESLALAAASHSGQPRHRARAARILADAGLDPAALQCPAALPADPAALVEHLAAGGAAEPILHNCSGKHAAMVATCARNGWPIAGYLSPAHPLQRAIVETTVRFGGEAIAATSVDGCGAPAHAISLTALAGAFAAIATAPHGSPAARIAAAMHAHPELVGGDGRPVTELMAEVPGLVCKDGAEGVWAAALPDGRAVAAKIGDGAGRALGPVLAAVLLAWGFDGPAVRRWSAVPVLGGGSSVGELRPSAALRDLLGRLR